MNKREQLKAMKKLSEGRHMAEVDMFRWEYTCKTEKNGEIFKADWKEAIK